MTYAVRYRSPPSIRIRLIRIRPKPLRVRSKNKQKEQLDRNIDRIVNNLQSGLELVQLPEKGRGVAAVQWFEAGDVVLNYCGEILSHKRGLKREKRLDRKDSSDSFLFFFSCDTTRYCLDATLEDGKYGRLVNHSRLRPNCKARTLKLNGKPAVVLFAIRDIAPGEEILYDYGEKRKEKIKENRWIVET